MENITEELTAKNSDYVHAVTKQLMIFGKTDEEIKVVLEEIIPQIIAAQKQGILARKLLGSPTNFVEQYAPAVQSDKKPAKDENTKFGWMWLDSSLLAFGFFAIVNSLGTFTSKNNPSFGLLTILLQAIFGGFTLWVLYYFFYSKPRGEARKGLWKSLLAVAGAVIVWLLMTSASTFIPASISIILPGTYMIVIGALALGLRWWLKAKFNVRSALTPTQRFNNPPTTKK